MQCEMDSINSRNFCITTLKYPLELNSGAMLEDLMMLPVRVLHPHPYSSHTYVRSSWQWNML